MMFCGLAEWILHPPSKRDNAGSIPAPTDGNASWMDTNEQSIRWGSSPAGIKPGRCQFY
jgi:hypothetical protein